MGLDAIREGMKNKGYTDENKDIGLEIMSWLIKSAEDKPLPVN